jgi:Protein of unknown function (DUF2975)
MNTNEISPKAGSRLQRIKRTSRILQSVFLIYFGMFGLVLLVGHIKTPIMVGGQSFGTLAEVPAELKIYEALRYSILLLAAIAISRLLEFYEKGIIFAAGTVSQIRRLGQLAVLYGVITACLPVFETHKIEFPVLPLNILLSPWLIVGCLTIIIAWIMDEGRKIQEEQELTV